jgi:hypothetical protein
MIASNAYAEDVRIFFDRTPTDRQSDLTPHAGVLAFENPTVAQGERLYIYAEFLDQDQWWWAIAFDVTADDGLITQAHYFNAPGQIAFNPPEARWELAAPNPLSRPSRSTVSFSSLGFDSFGVRNPPFAPELDPIQFRDPSRDGGSIAGTTLLGYVEVSPAPGFDRAEVFFSVGAGGIQHSNGLARNVYFGFGDAPVWAYSRDRSALPDAIAIPEPGTLAALLVLVGLGKGHIASRRNRGQASGRLSVPGKCGRRFPRGRRAA